MTANLLDSTLDEILRHALSEADEDLIVVNPSKTATQRIVSVATHFEKDLPHVKLLAVEDTLKDVMDDFIVASNAADLVEADRLSLRTAQEAPENSLLLTADSVIALVSVGSRVGGLVSEDEAFVGRAYDAYSEQWDDAEAFGFRTPAISRVNETLAEDIGPEAQADFQRMLDSLETARGDGDGLDEVTISLLVAAKNEALLYDISKWGEDVGIASKATFSRTKTKLEDMGLITTEKVPIDVGRPRLRLKLGDERLQNADNGQLATVATSILN